MDIYYLLIVLYVIRCSCAENNSLIIDYFYYKQVTHVAGFTCKNKIENNIALMKMFSSYRISATVNKLKRSSSILKSLLNNAYWNLGIFVDLRCNNIKSAARVFSKAAEIGLYSNLFKWLILSWNLEDSIKLINDTSFSILTDMTIAVPKNKIYIMYEVYNHCAYRGGSLIINEIGNWENSDKLHFSYTGSQVSRRGNFRQMELKSAGLINYRPENITIIDYLQDYSTTSKDTSPKFTYAILLLLADIFNFTVNPTEMTKWESNDTNGPLVRALYNNDVDISGSANLMTRDRLKYIEYVYPVWPFRTFFVFRTAAKSNIKMYEVLKPLAIKCWLFTIILVLISFFVYIAVLKYENIGGMQRISVAFLFIIGALCQQGSSFLPYRIAGRIAFLHVMFFSLLIYNYYSASIVSTRLNEPLDKINDSLVELAKTNMECATEPSLFFNFIIKQTDWETSTFYKKRWLRIPPQKRYVSVEDGVKRVLEGGFAYHTTPEAIYPSIERLFNNHKICELTEVHLTRPTIAYLNTRIGSPFSEITKIGSMKLFEKGLLRRQLKKWSTRKPECRHDILNVESVSIQEFASILIILLCGHVLAIAIYEMEKWFYKLRNEIH